MGRGTHQNLDKKYAVRIIKGRFYLCFQQMKLPVSTIIGECYFVCINY